MATVTRIVQQKDKNRANIYLGGKFAFGTSLESLLKHRLKTGNELDPQTVKQLKEESNAEKIYARVLRFATLRQRSQKEIEDWFKRKKVDISTAKKVFNRLKKLDLVNDREFAKWWIQQRTTFRSHSRKLLSYELRQKGVEQEIIAQVLKTAEVPSETELAKTALRKKFKSLSSLTQKQLQKVYGFLARRGFSWGVIKQAVDEVGQEE